MSILNIPLILTLIRLILSPVILPFLFVYLLPINNIFLNILVASVFIGFSLTDFFDGYLARKYNQVTALGSILDPIADKFLVYSVLIALLAVHKIFFLWVVILIGREFFMMGLRQVALEHQFSIAVSSYGKLKTALQIICLSFIIINAYQSEGLGVSRKAIWNDIEFVLLLATTFFSVHSAIRYYQVFITLFVAERAKISVHEKG